MRSHLLILKYLSKIFVIGLPTLATVPHHFEKSYIRGMRITVYDVLSYLAAGMSYEEILEDFPYLTREDILACLSYAADREQQTLTVTR
jgi:uncharacterized protein (DUF433 family)